MKRFWKEVRLRETETADGRVAYEIRLDGRPLTTPKKHPLHIPGRALALAIRDEWDGAGAEFSPADMPLTGLANATIDIVAHDHDGFAAGLARYAENDLLCYRADAPGSLVARQDAVWDPILDRTRTVHGLTLRTVTGIIHQPQPEEALAKVRGLFQRFSPWELAALAPVAQITGSAILTLTLADGAIGTQDGFDAAMLDELWQETFWGTDHEAQRVRELRRGEYETALRFLALLREGTPADAG